MQSEAHEQVLHLCCKINQTRQTMATQQHLKGNNSVIIEHEAREDPDNFLAGQRLSVKPTPEKGNIFAHSDELNQI